MLISVKAVMRAEHREHKAYFKDIYGDIKEGFAQLGCISNPIKIKSDADMRGMWDTFTIRLKVFTSSAVKSQQEALSLFLQAYRLSSEVPALRRVENFTCEDITNYNRSLSLLFMDLEEQTFRQIAAKLGSAFKVNTNDNYYRNVFYSHNFNFNESAGRILSLWQSEGFPTPTSITIKGKEEGIPLPDEVFQPEILTVLKQGRERKESICILRTVPQLLSEIGLKVVKNYRLLDCFHNFQTIEFTLGANMLKSDGVYDFILAKGNQFICKVSM